MQKWKKKLAKNEENGGKSLRVPNVSSYCSKYFRRKLNVLYAFEEEKTCSNTILGKTYWNSKLGF